MRIVVLMFALLVSGSLQAAENNQWPKSEAEILRWETIRSTQFFRGDELMVVRADLNGDGRPELLIDKVSKKDDFETYSVYLNVGDDQYREVEGFSLDGATAVYKEIEGTGGIKGFVYTFPSSVDSGTTGAIWYDAEGNLHDEVIDRWKIEDPSEIRSEPIPQEQLPGQQYTVQGLDPKDFLTPEEYEQLREKPKTLFDKYTTGYTTGDSRRKWFIREGEVFVGYVGTDRYGRWTMEYVDWEECKKDIELGLRDPDKPCEPEVNEKETDAEKKPTPSVPNAEKPQPEDNKTIENDVEPVEAESETNWLLFGLLGLLAVLASLFMWKRRK